MKSDTLVCLCVFLTTIFESVATLETKLDDNQTQSNDLPRWFDPATMRVVKKDDTLYLGYCDFSFHLSLFAS
jgi:hypothetical protein